MNDIFHRGLCLLNEWLTIVCVFPAIFCLGFYLTIKLRGIQLRKTVFGAKSLLKYSGESSGNITPFQAVSAVLAGNLGTGNISGMAVAIATGGPGALVWMWFMVVIGSVIQYANCVLGAKYRVQDSSGEFLGGPMYYLRDGMKAPFLASLFSVFTIFGAFTVGNLVQIHSICLPLSSIGLNSFALSLCMTAVVAIVLLGGTQRFARIAATIVPCKAVIYLGCALAIIFLHVEKLPDACRLLYTGAYNPAAVFGGVAGFSMLKVVATGFERGIFATDIGTGIVPILQASARTGHPVMTGIISLVAPFVVMIVCMATGIVLLVTGAWQAGLESTNMVAYAFETGLNSVLGKYVVIVSLLLFAYTTILAWACCMEKAVSFLWGERAIRPMRYLFIGCVPFGTLLHVASVWALADICISCMVVVNLIGVIALSQTVIQETKEYFGWGSCSQNTDTQATHVEGVETNLA